MFLMLTKKLMYVKHIFTIITYVHVHPLTLLVYVNTGTILRTFPQFLNKVLSFDNGGVKHKIKDQS